MRDVFSGMVDYVSVDTPDGRAGFLYGALPRVAVLSEGVIEVTIGEEKIGFYAADGVYSITKDGMTVATSECVGPDEARDGKESGTKLGKQLDYAKARIASSLIKMKGKNSVD